MSKFYLPNLNLEYHLCRWAKKIDGSTVALAIFLYSKGILIYEKIYKAYMMYALGERSTKNIVNMIPKDAELIVGHKELDFILL